MGELYCAFHPKRPAAGTCKECGKGICLECQNPYYPPQVENSGPQPATLILCPLCFVEQTDRTLDRGVIALPLCFVVSAIATIVAVAKMYDWSIPWETPSYVVAIIVIIAIPFVLLGLIVY